MFASVVGVFENETGKLSLRYQRIPLDASYADSPSVAMFKQYQEELQQAVFRD